MRRYPPSPWDTARAAIGCIAVLAVVVVVVVLLYLITPVAMEWIAYLYCYVALLLGFECPAPVAEWVPKREGMMRTQRSLAAVLLSGLRLFFCLGHV